MKSQYWIFSIRCARHEDSELSRCAVVGPAQESTVEKALCLSGLPESACAEIRAHKTVRTFLEGECDPEGPGYYVHTMSEEALWCVCIGAVHAVLDAEAENT